MFKITNQFSNALTLSDGLSIAPGETVERAGVEEKERNYERRNWLRIIDEKAVSAKKAPAAKTKKAAPKADPVSVEKESAEDNDSEGNDSGRDAPKGDEVEESAGE